ncbi:hypothetical protein VNO80_01431 [Phaseolus coccineus]|uniref:Uncharacterized protein n=1 Tax=Phaseolus coccineus TaxID=3886 RepID=A0AAN9RST3_PHACN
MTGNSEKPFVIEHHKQMSKRGRVVSTATSLQTLCPSPKPLPLQYDAVDLIRRRFLSSHPQGNHLYLQRGIEPSHRRRTGLQLLVQSNAHPDLLVTFETSDTRCPTRTIFLVRRSGLLSRVSLLRMLNKL